MVKLRSKAEADSSGTPSKSAATFLGENMPTPPSPSPKPILGSHRDQIASLHISDDNETLYSGDITGLVASTATRTLRALVAWKTHVNAILAVKEWEGVDQYIISHERDDKLHIWKKVTDATLNVERLWEALQFRRWGSQSQSCWLAMVDAANWKADARTLPTCQSLHAAIGKARPGSEEVKEVITTEGAAESNKPTRPTPPRRTETGIIMSLHLHRMPHPSTSTATELRILMAYEAGNVECWAFRPTHGKLHSIEGIGWEQLWNVRFHAESVMAMAVSRGSTLALSVSADHLVGRYDLKNAPSDVQASCTIARTKHPGNGSIAIHDPGKVCALGGWDGKIRLYSTKTYKSLGTLDYHKDGIQAMTFARSTPPISWPSQNQSGVDRGGSRTGVTPTSVGGGDAAGDDEEEDEFGNSEFEARKRWLVAGGKDGRISVWELMDFAKPKP